MAQLNDLLVMGQSTLLGPVNIQNDVLVTGTIKTNDKEVLTKEEASKTYITATLDGNTLTITIP